MRCRFIPKGQSNILQSVHGNGEAQSLTSQKKRIILLLGLVCINVIWAIYSVIDYYVSYSEAIPSFGWYPVFNLILLTIIFYGLLKGEYWGWIAAVVVFGFALLQNVIYYFSVIEAYHLSMISKILLNSTIVALLIWEKDSYENGGF